MATNANQPAEKEGQGKFDLIFPAHLNALIAQDVGHPHLIIRNNENNKQICLPVPEALSLDDGANYEGLDRSQFRTLEGFKEGGGASISEEDKLAFGLSKTNIVPGLDALAKETMFQRRIAKNPMTEMTFTGMNMRTLGLSFDLVPRNESEAKTIRDIEILLRSLMYPEKTGNTGYTVRYPAMFEIQFMAGENESRFFPLFHHAYLSGLNTNFRGQAGAYMRVGDDFIGLKHTIALTFTEAKMLTRNDIDELPERGEMAVNTPTKDGDAAAKGTINQAKANNKKSGDD